MDDLTDGDSPLNFAVGTPEQFCAAMGALGVGDDTSAVNIPAFALVDESGRYRPHDELAAMFEGDRNARTITYCGGGIAASSDAFIMTRLGFTNVAVYTASLQEWAADPANPMVVD